MMPRNIAVAGSPRGRSAASACTRDDHRGVGGVDDGGTDRSEQHTAEAAEAMAADYDKLSGPFFIEQVAGWVVEHHAWMHIDIGVARAPAHQILGQCLAGGSQDRRLLGSGKPRHVMVIPGMQS